MSPSFLIIGATGNTGRGLVELLSENIQSSQTFSNYRILAQTRSAGGSVAKELAKLRNVEIVENNWPDITPQWLREQDVVRAFIASHNNTNFFAEETTFHWAALRAGVKYVVRISTTAANVRPDNEAYYTRTHWAIETMLDTPAYQSMHWTSLRANMFFNMFLGASAEFIKNVRAGNEQGTLHLVASEDAPVGIIDPYDVSRFAAKLLLEEDTSPHNKVRYVLNGPEDINGEDVVAMVEERIGAKVKDVSFKDMSVLDPMVTATTESKNVISSLKTACQTAWAGLCKAETTSKEVLRLAPAQIRAGAALDAMLQ